MDGLDTGGLRWLLRHHPFNIVGKYKPHSMCTIILFTQRFSYMFIRTYALINHSPIKHCGLDIGLLE